jgi:hypothetical protein
MENEQELIPVDFGDPISNPHWYHSTTRRQYLSKITKKNQKSLRIHTCSSLLVCKVMCRCTNSDIGTWSRIIWPFSYQSDIVVSLNLSWSFHLSLILYQSKIWSHFLFIDSLIHMHNRAKRFPKWKFPIKIDITWQQDGEAFWNFADPFCSNSKGESKKNTKIWVKTGTCGHCSLNFLLKLM